jgi:hypothetical protein
LSSGLEDLIEVPIQELPARPVGSVFGQFDDLPGLGVEVIVAAEVCSQAGLTRSLNLGSIPRYPRSNSVWMSERSSSPLSSRCSPPALTGRMCVACSTGGMCVPVTAQRRW